MYINVNLQTINLAGSGIAYDADDNLYDLFAQYGDGRICVNGPESSYYQFPDNHIFALMDTFEQSIPTLGHTVCWNWTGVRKEAEYFLQLEVKVLSDETAHFWDVFNKIFPDIQKQDEPFELPEVDHPLNIDDPEANDHDDGYNEYDEEFRLRDLEILTLGNPALQWKREPMEYGGGAGIITTIGVAAGVGSFGHAFLKDFVKSMMKNHYSREIEHLQRKVIKACKGKGHLIPPKPEAPKVYNMEAKEYEYEFTQIMSDGARNRVFIGVESKKVTFVPYR